MDDLKDGINEAAGELNKTVAEVKEGIIETFSNVKLEDVSKPISELLSFKNLFD